MQKRNGAVALAITTLLLARYGLAQQAPATQPVVAGAVADVPVKEVVLFSSGVGYFQHEGMVQGDGSTELRFKTNQINDILKSLVLQDLDGGKVGAVTYPSQDPIGKMLKSFAVDITANPPMADLLNQLRGARVTMVVSAEKIDGVILGVEVKKRAVGDKGETVEQAVLNLVSGGKILSQPMDGISSIQLDDPALQEELNKALLALAGARDQDKKPVKISFNGTGQRHVRMGYVVETPIWKASYRLILTDEPGRQLFDRSKGQPAPVADGNLQGWAIVENQTDNDWNNVQLSLVSGRPISFVEDLYQPLYIPRPVVEPDLFASLRPQSYAGGIDRDGVDQAKAALSDSPQNAHAMDSLDQQLGFRKEALQQMQFAGAAGGGANAMSAPVAAPMNFTASVGSLASAANVGELFEYTVGNVSLARQSSAMIPIITDPIEVERVSIYNQSVLPRNPLNGVRVKNTTKNHLLAGPVTVLDGASYAGDAQIDNLPPGQQRLLSYGVDLQMQVDAVNNSRVDELQSGKIVKGVLTVMTKTVASQDYVAENKSDHEKVLIVEHPRQGGWDLVDSPEAMEKTDGVYRFRESVPAGKVQKLTVKEQIVQSQEMAILPTDSSSLDYYRQQGQIPKAVQDALSKAMQLKQAVVDTQRQIDQDKAHLDDITKEQVRIRDNLRAVKASSQYYDKLMTKLNEQEDDIARTQIAIGDLEKQVELQRGALEDYLANLTVG